MKIKLKWVVAVEASLILALILFILIPKPQNACPGTGNGHTGLLSPRVYAGLLKPKNFLITNFDPLQARLDDYISENRLNVSVYVQNLRNGAEMEINKNIPLFPASLNKIPIGILILQKIEKKELMLDSMIEIRDEDRVSDSSELYKTKEKELPLRVLLESMLKNSDNTAFKVLLGLIGKHDLELLLNYNDLNPESTYLLQKKLAGSGELVTPVEISNIFRSLYLSSVLGINDSEYVLMLLTQDIFDIKKAAALPDNVIVAHKFGAYYSGGYKYFHDCGIMYIGESRMLYCIMTKDIDEQKAIRTIGIFVNSIYSYTNYTREYLNTYREQGYI